MLNYVHQLMLMTHNPKILRHKVVLPHEQNKKATAVRWHERLQIRRHNQQFSEKTETLN